MVTDKGRAKVNVVKTLAIGQELMQKGNRERVVKLLRQAFSWKTSVDTEKCEATMQAILESYIKERRKQRVLLRYYSLYLETDRILLQKSKVN